VVILAAGQGKRMVSDLPKVLAPLAGEPLLSHVLALARQLNPESIHVVVGHGAERVREHFREARVQWALQGEQLGTGHAVSVALPAIPDHHRVLVLYGDVPLLRLETLQSLLGALTARPSERGFTLLTARFANAYGYGRIIRNSAGQPQRIVEETDASARQRRIQEANTGVMVANAGQLKRWLGRLKPHNAQGEYYLTDVLAEAVREKCAIATLEATDTREIMGVNDRSQLADAESEYRRRRAEELMAQGVTLVDPSRIDIRGPVTVGRDVLIDVDVVLQGTVTLGDRVRIGPGCVIQDSIIGAETELHSHCVLQRTHIGKKCAIGPLVRLEPGAKLPDKTRLNQKDKDTQPCAES
jgi:bifunctional UDP-N-acetylglucosamine pyrophosphorylase / glucosamine-1-phosphate N-acetyltransferase